MTDTERLDAFEKLITGNRPWIATGWVRYTEGGYLVEHTYRVLKGDNSSGLLREVTDLREYIDAAVASSAEAERETK